MRTSLLRMLVACCLLAVSATACTVSRSSSPEASAGQSAAPTPSPAKPAPRMSEPLPPERVVPASAKVDRSCKTNADCVVKDVGNCCGTMPACVNVDSPTDPKGVQAECKRKGTMSVCGFPALEGCTCSRGQCIALPPSIEPSIDPAPTPPVEQ